MCFFHRAACPAHRPANKWGKCTRFWGEAPDGHRRRIAGRSRASPNLRENSPGWLPPGRQQRGRRPGQRLGAKSPRLRASAGCRVITTFSRLEKMDRSAHSPFMSNRASSAPFIGPHVMTLIPFRTFVPLLPQSRGGPRIPGKVSTSPPALMRGSRMSRMLMMRHESPGRTRSIRTD